MNPLPDENEAPQGKNAFNGIIADMTTRNLANTKGGNKVENLVRILAACYT